MKVQGNARVRGRPKFRAKARSGPMAVELEGSAGFKLATSTIAARVHEIPITMQIPFLRRKHGFRTVATIGGFGVSVKPFEVTVEAFGVRFCGLLCKDGFEGELEGQMECDHEVDVQGTLLGRLAKVAIALDDDDAIDEALQE